jgi:hypothetical protein
MKRQFRNKIFVHHTQGNRLHNSIINQNKPICIPQMDFISKWLYIPIFSSYCINTPQVPQKTHNRKHKAQIFNNFYLIELIDFIPYLIFNMKIAHFMRRKCEKGEKNEARY